MEILKRKVKLEKTTIDQPSFQVALNSWGHLTIRRFDKTKPEEDHLIVFDVSETQEIIAFLRRMKKLDQYA